MTVINHQISVLLSKIEITVVTGAVSKLTVPCLENSSVIAEIAEKRLCSGYVYTVRSLSPFSRGPHKIIFTAVLEDARTFHIVGRRDLLEYLSVGERNETVHFFVHDSDIAVSPTAVQKIDRTVIILEKVRVNGLRLCKKTERRKGNNIGGVITNLQTSIFPILSMTEIKVS
jgi:hypothetical protein